VRQLQGTQAADDRDHHVGQHRHLQQLDGSIGRQLQGRHVIAREETRAEARPRASAIFIGRLRGICNRVIGAARSRLGERAFSWLFRQRLLDAVISSRAAHRSVDVVARDCGARSLFARDIVAHVVPPEDLPSSREKNDDSPADLHCRRRRRMNDVTTEANTPNVETFETSRLIARSTCSSSASKFPTLSD